MQSFVDPDRVAVAGTSFGGIEVVLGTEKASYCAEVDSAGAAQSWGNSPELQDLMTRAVRNSKAPIFFFQAANDYDLSPSRTLSAAMKNAGKEFEVKIYKAFGSSVQDGYSFGYFGSEVWGPAILRQLTFHGSNGCLPSIEFLDGLALQSIELGVSYESDRPSSSGAVHLF
jgi:dienelactone hydrolase